MIKKYKKIILIIGITVILFFVYSYFFGGNESENLIESTVNAPTGAEAIGSDIIQALSQIETLKLERNIFSDPVYRSLVDRSKVLTPEPVGRNNPFAPVGANSNNDTFLEISSDDADDSDVGETSTTTNIIRIKNIE